MSARPPAVCRVCGYSFVEADNLGSWACGQHAEPRDRATGIYPCCGARGRENFHVLRRGCVRADHNANPLGPEGMPVPWTRWHDVTLTDVSIDDMPHLRREAVISSGEDGYFREMRVRRFADPKLALFAE